VIRSAAVREEPSIAKPALTCRICSRPVRSADPDLVIGDEGLVHAACVKKQLTCPACARPIQPGEDVRTMGRDIFHAGCRSAPGPSVLEPRSSLR
jgi:hypothetical protein